MFACIEGYYNRQRYHSALGRVTPNRQSVEPLNQLATKSQEVQEFAVRSRTVSIVIPTRNKCRSLMRTLASLERIDLTKAEFEVVVVDDASNDGTDSWLADYRPGFQLRRLRNDPQVGPASARNRGSRLANGEILLFLDDDMVCDAKLAEAHMAHHESGEGVAVVGRSLYHPELKRSALTHYFDAQHLRHGSPLCPPPRFASNNLSLSRSLFERAGQFDKSLSCVGLEDVELGIRLMQIPGCVLRYEPRAFAYHYHDQSLRDYTRKVETAGAKNLAILASKWPAELDKGALGWLVAKPSDGWPKIAVQTLLSVPGVNHLLLPLAETAPGTFLNRILVKYLLASSMLRGHQRSLAEPSAPAKESFIPGHVDGVEGNAKLIGNTELFEDLS